VLVASEGSERPALAGLAAYGKNSRSSRPWRAPEGRGSRTRL